MRNQAIRTLEELHNELGCTLEDEENLFAAIECTYDDVDDMEEDLYNLTAREFAFNIGLEYEEDDEEEAED